MLQNEHTMDPLSHSDEDFINLDYFISVLSGNWTHEQVQSVELH